MPKLDDDIPTEPPPPVPSKTYINNQRRPSLGQLTGGQANNQRRPSLGQLTGGQANNPQYPGNQGQYPGNQGQYPGNHAQYPGNQGQHPGNQGQYPGNQGQYAGNQGQYSGNQGQYSGNQAQYSDSRPQDKRTPCTGYPAQHPGNQSQGNPGNQSQGKQSQYAHHQAQYPHHQAEYTDCASQYPGNQGQGNPGNQGNKIPYPDYQTQRQGNVVLGSRKQTTSDEEDHYETIPDCLAVPPPGSRHSARRASERSISPYPTDPHYNPTSLPSPPYIPTPPPLPPLPRSAREYTPWSPPTPPYSQHSPSAVGASGPGQSPPVIFTTDTIVAAKRRLKRTQGADRTPGRPGKQVGRSYTGKEPDLPLKEKIEKQRTSTPVGTKDTQNIVISQARAQEPKEQDNINFQPWFWGKVTREMAEVIVYNMKTDGTFLVRNNCRQSDTFAYTLTVLWGQELYHVYIRENADRQFALGFDKDGEKWFPSVPALIQYYREFPIYLSTPRGDNKGHVTLSQWPENPKRTC